MKHKLLLCAMLATSTVGMCGTINQNTLQSKSVDIPIKQDDAPVDLSITPETDLNEKTLGEGSTLATVEMGSTSNPGQSRLAVWFAPGQEKQEITGTDLTQAVITDVSSEKTLSVKLTGTGTTTQKEDNIGSVIVTNDKVPGKVSVQVVLGGVSAQSGSYPITLNAGEWTE